MSLNGAVDTPAAKAPTFLADDLAGLHGALAALAALYHRDRTGEGQHVDVSMLDAMLFQSNGFLTLGATDVPLARWGAEVEFFVPSNAFECADGQVYIVVALDKHWRALATAIGHPELATAPGFATNDERRGNRAAVNRLVADWCRERTTSAVIGVLERVEVTVAQMASFADAATDPHVLARDMLQETRLSNGTVAPIVGPAAKFSRTPTRVRSGAPAPGTHTAQILETLAFRRAVR
jgi:formyl-CoA transferase